MEIGLETIVEEDEVLQAQELDELNIASMSLSSEELMEEKGEDYQEPEMTKERQEWLEWIYFVDDYVSEFFYQSDEVLEQDVTRQRSIANLKHKHSQKQRYDDHLEKKIQKYFSRQESSKKKHRTRAQSKKQTKQRNYARFWKTSFQNDHTINITSCAHRGKSTQKATMMRERRRQMGAMIRAMKLEARKAMLAARVTFQCPLCPYLHQAVQAQAHLTNKTKYAFLHPSFDCFEMKFLDNVMKKVKILPSKNNSKATERRKRKRGMASSNNIYRF